MLWTFGGEGSQQEDEVDRLSFEFAFDGLFSLYTTII